MVIELARYLVEQIAADGYEGSSVERLNRFIDEYEKQQSSAREGEKKRFDLHERNYAISIALRHPSIHAGSFLGPSSSLVKEEKTNAKRKVKEGDDSDEDNEKNEEQGGLSKTFINEDIHARESDLATLQEKHGEKLRLFADEKAISRVITGNKSSLTPNLRIVMLYLLRQRGDGATFPQIMSDLKITNSNLYLQMLHLLEKGLIYKLKNSVHIYLIATKFAHLSTVYNSHEMLLDGNYEEGENATKVKEEEEHNHEEDVTLQHVTEEDLAGQMILQDDEEQEHEKTGAEDDVYEDIYEDVKGDQSIDPPSAGELTTHGGTSVYPQLQSEDAITALTNNRARLRERILRLLIESPKGIILRQGLSFRVGLPPEYTFHGRAVVRALNEMRTTGLLQCRTFNIDLNGVSEKRRCLVLTEEGTAHFHRQKTSVHEKYISSLREKLQSQAEVHGQSGIQVEIPFERQLVEEIARSGPNGTTIDDLNRFFGGNELRRRDIDRILTTAKTQMTLPQYSDLFISSALGQEGRKRVGRFRVQQWLSYQVAGKANIETLKLSNLRSAIENVPEIRLDESDIGKFVLHNNKVRKRGPGKKQSVSAQSTPSKPKGRPRKDYSYKALAAAARYRAKRGLPDEDGNSVLASPSASEVNRPKRGRPRKRPRMESESEAEVTMQDNEKSTDNPDGSYNALQSDTREADETLATTMDEPDQNMKDRSRASEDETDEEMEDSTAVPQDEIFAAEQSRKEDETADRTIEIFTGVGKKPNSTARFNVSMQAKYELLLEFFEKVQLVIARIFDREYSNFVANANISDLKRKNWKMDMKVRNKLIAALIENEKIERQFVSIKIGKRETKQVLYFLKGLSGQRINDFLERVRRDNVLGPNRNSERTYISDNTVLKEGDLEIPAPGSMAGLYRVDFVTDSLDDLLSNPKFRAQIVKHAHVRSSFAGRFEGLVARARLVHQETWKWLNHPSEDVKRFIKGDNVIDLACWAFEPILQLYLQLAITPHDNLLLSASQNARMLEQPVAKLDKRLRDSLELSEDGDGGGVGCRQTLGPVMKFLCDLQLVVPVSYNGHEYVPVERDEDHSLYQFVPEFNKPIWNSQGDFEPQMDRLKFDSQIDVHLFWSKLNEFRKGKDTGIPDEPQNPDDPEEALWISNAKIIKLHSAWDTSYRLYKPQKVFFEQARHLGINANHIDDQVMLKKLSYASVTPVVFVQSHLRRVFGLTEQARRPDAANRSNNGTLHLLSKFSRGEKVTKALSLKRLAGPLTLHQAKRQENRIKRKARESREERGKEFDNLLDTFFSHHNIEEEDREQFTKGMVLAREAYSKGANHMNIDEVKAMLQIIQTFNETGEMGTYRSIVRRKEAYRRDRRKPQRISVSGFSAIRKARKSVFEWSQEADELLRDCCVILRARDHYRQPTGTVRKNWKALLRIFPLCTMSALHRRFEKLKSAVGEEAYLAQLEVEWRKLWSAFRQTDLLPDYDPKDAIAFDLQVHVNFLRKRIDKFAVLETLRSGTNESLPMDVENLDSLYDLDRPPYTHLVLDNSNVITRHYAGDGTGDVRSDHLVRASFSTFMLDGTLVPSNLEQKQDWTFESRKKLQIAFALKRMLLITSDQAYDEELSRNLKQINNIEEKDFEQARNHLLSARLCKPKEHEEGRQVEGDPDQWTSEWSSFISDQNFETIPIWQITESAIENAISLSTSNENGNTDEILEVFRAASNVETAAGILLADRGDVDVEIDLKSISRLSSNRIFNAKKATDLDLEIPVRVKAEHNEPLNNKLANISRKHENLLENLPKEEFVLEWAKDNSDFAKRTIRWEKACNSWLKANMLADENMSEATTILEHLKSAGPEGITRSDIKSICIDEGFSLDLLTHLIVELLKFSPALAFEAGWDDCRLVASIYVNDWTMIISDHSQQSQRKIIPRPWFDMFGKPKERIWHNCCALVLHAITINPGLSLSQIIFQLQKEGALTRMDVCHLIRCAHQEGLIEFVSAYDPTQIGEKVYWMANNDEEVGLVNKNCLI